MNSEPSIMPKVPHPQHAPVVFQVLAPSGWILRSNLTSDELQQLFQLRSFCQEGMKRWGHLHVACNTLQQQQNYLAGFQSREQQMATDHAIRHLMHATIMQSQMVENVYRHFVILGFDPPCPPHIAPSATMAQL